MPMCCVCKQPRLRHKCENAQIFEPGLFTHVIASKSNRETLVRAIIIVFVIMQLIYYFGVNIRICGPEISDVQQGEAEENITFEG